MLTTTQERQRFIRYYKEKTGKEDVVMKEVAQFAVKMGWKLPPPTDPIDRLAKQFAEAAREEIRHDKKTERPYRANHAITTMQGNQQLTFWIDIDEAPRHKTLKALMQYREEMVGEAVIVTNCADHWNSVNPQEEPITIPLDFTDDVSWRLNAPEEVKAS
jgi:hypothetical protein